MRILFFATAATLLFSCNQNKSTNEEPASENKFAGTDKIVYTFNAGTYPGALEYDITVTPKELVLKLNASSQEEEVKKTYPFTDTKWEKLIASFGGLRIKGEATNDCDGGGSEGLSFYKDGEKTASANDYQCGKNGRNFRGAKLDLSYLVKNFDKLKASLLEKKEPCGDPDSDDAYKWTAAERKAFLEECSQLPKARESDAGAEYFCNCTLGKLQIAFATKDEAYEKLQDKTDDWLEKCRTKKNQ